MERALDGLSAAPGFALGAAHVLADAADLDRAPVAEDRRAAEVDRARRALERASAEIEAIAARLRGSGQSEEAEIVETGAMIARDPTLQRETETAVLQAGVPAAAAILDAASAQAALIAGLDEPLLAERADDIRSVGRRAAGLVGLGVSPKSGAGNDNGEGRILIATDLGPAEVAELEGGVAGIALAAGGVSAHAAIVARSLGIPMVVGVGRDLLGAGAGDPVVVDGSNGIVFLAPDEARLRTAELEVERRTRRRARALAARELPAVTEDGRRVCVLANVSGAAELRPALEAGAEGVGLLRTELAFLAASGWPSEGEQRRVVGPVLARLQGSIATVRLLDFGGDKTPPFLRGSEKRGIQLLLDHPEALGTQLRAILAVAGSSELRILVPMVDDVEQIRLVRRAVLEALEELPAVGRPRIGAMIETPQGVNEVAGIAAEVDFLSIGTNDLTHSVLGADRFSSDEAHTHDPRVLRAIATVVAAAKRALIPIEVCGEAASDPIMAPLLVGAGVDEISVGAARVGTVREWVRSLNFARVSDLEVAARRLATAAQVEALVADVSSRLSLLERADANGEVLERPVGVGAAGAEA